MVTMPDGRQQLFTSTGSTPCRHQTRYLKARGVKLFMVELTITVIGGT
jgi:hypothetical protein